MTDKVPLAWRTVKGSEYRLTETTHNNPCNGCAFSGKTECPMYSDGKLLCMTGNSPGINYHFKKVSFVTEDNPNLETEQKIKDKPEKGVKYDSDKRQWWYFWQFLPELEQVVDILAFGDKKYPAEDGSNWRRVEQSERRYSSALMRHLSLYLQGEKNDPETGKSHLAHLITNALFLMWFDRTTKGTK